MLSSTAPNTPALETWIFAPTSSRLREGTYDAVTGAATEDVPGISTHNACNAPLRFIVDEVGYSASGRISRLAMRFDAVCKPPSDPSYRVFGSLAWQATGDVLARHVVRPYVSYDTVEVGRERIERVELANDGRTALPVHAVGISGSPTFIVVHDGCSGEVLAAGTSCTVDVRYRPTKQAAEEAWLAISDEVTAGLGGFRVLLRATGTTVPWPMGAYGELITLNPDRVLDTRTGLGRGAAGPIQAGRAVEVQVAGVGGVPGSGVQLVALNVTVTEPTSRAWLSVYPAGGRRPLASSVNFAAGQTVPNLVVARPGSGGKVEVFLSAGSAHVVFDVVGFWADETYPGKGSRLTPLGGRFFDSRTTRARLGPGQTIEVVAPRSSVPTFAVAINITAIAPTAPTFLTVYPADQPVRPPTSNVNVVAGQTRPNATIVRLPADGKIKIYNHSGSVHVALDLQGWFTHQTHPALGRVIGLDQPVRIVDTREGEASPLPGGYVDTWTFDQLDQTFGMWVHGFILNATATAATEPTYLSLFDADWETLPPWSNLNAGRGEDVANLAISNLSAKTSIRQLAVYNHAGTAHYVLDLAAVVMGPLYAPPLWPEPFGVTAATASSDRAASEQGTVTVSPPLLQREQP